MSTRTICQRSRASRSTADPGIGSIWVAVGFSILVESQICIDPIPAHITCADSRQPAKSPPCKIIYAPGGGLSVIRGISPRAIWWFSMLSPSHR